MGQRIYIQLARYGDILNILPLAYDDAQNGDRSAIMVSKQFADVLDGCSYVDRIIYDGGPWELEQAVKNAESQSDRVLNVQLAGPYEAVRNVVTTRNGQEYKTVTESFLKDQWKLAGRLGDWKKQLPLIFDLRDPQREEKLIQQYLPKRKNTILLATGGTSSPFEYRELLHEIIRLKFGRNYNIVDLSAIKAERIYDLLGLFEHGSTRCLVATDSAPLHLAYACRNLPVAALVNDKPSLWHGSCWRANHIFHARYHDFPHRALELLSAIEGLKRPGSILNEDITSPKIVHIWSGYEPGHDADAWMAQYSTNSWLATPVHRGALGRDSVTQLKDEKRYPFLRDVVRIATLRANDDDTICLSRAETVPRQADLTALILAASTPLYFRRSHMGLYHPAVDMFCFKKKWWQEHQNEVPDLILGKDRYWHRVFSELLKLHGGVEVEMAVVKP